jgi:hypothetical protein
MPKFNITLARLVRETASVEIEAVDCEDAEEKASEIYSADEFNGEDLKWEPDADWGADEGTHNVEQEG